MPVDELQIAETCPPSAYVKIDLFLFFSFDFNSTPAAATVDVADLGEIKCFSGEN